MHIEINAGGLSGGIAVASFQNGMKKYVSKTDGMISSFKAVRTKTYNLNGGVGTHLEGAVNQVLARERTEEQRKSGAETVQAKSNDFLDLAIRVDKQVTSIVKQDRKELYGKYPSLKPSLAQWAKERLSDAWNWLCGAAKTVAKGVAFVADSVRKIANSIINFLQDERVWDSIIALVIGVASACAAIFALPEILAGIGITGIAAGIICAIFAIASVISVALNIENIWGALEGHSVLQKIRVVTTAIANIGLTLSLGMGAETLLENFLKNAVFLSEIMSAQKALNIASVVIKLSISLPIMRDILDITGSLFNLDNNPVHKIVQNILRTLHEILEQIFQFAYVPPPQLQTAFA